MDPYIHAAGGRGEGFRADDIDSLDKFAHQQHQIDEALDETRGWRRIQDWLRKFVACIFKQ